MKTFYCVIPKKFKVEEMHVLFLGKTKHLALRAFQKWNNDATISETTLPEFDLEIRKIKAIN